MKTQEQQPKPSPLDPQGRWTKLKAYLVKKDKHLVQLMRQAGLRPDLSAQTGAVVANAGALGLMGQILARVEELENDIDRDTAVPAKRTQPTRPQEDY